MMRVHGNSGQPGGVVPSVQGPQGGVDAPPPPPPPPPSPTDPVDTTTLSKEALAALGEGGEKVRGKSAESPAHKARAWLDTLDAEALDGISFGKLVSHLAQGGEEDGLAALLGIKEDPTPTTLVVGDPPPDDPPTDPVVDPLLDPPVDPTGGDAIINLLTPDDDPDGDDV